MDYRLITKKTLRQLRENGLEAHYAAYNEENEWRALTIFGRGTNEVAAFNDLVTKLEKMNNSANIWSVGVCEIERSTEGALCNINWKINT